MEAIIAIFLYGFYLSFKKPIFLDQKSGKSSSSEF
jgi:hypothetical protein